MANDFQNSIANNVGTSRTDFIYYSFCRSKRSIIGLELCNISGNAITVDVDVYDNSATAYVTIGNNLAIPANSTLSFVSGQKIVLANA